MVLVLLRSIPFEISYILLVLPTGAFFAFGLNENGTIGKKLYEEHFGENSHIHHIVLSGNGDFLFITDLGNDKLFAYQVIETSSGIDFCKVDCFSFPSGTQPRHIAISDYDLYVITEASYELYHLRFLEDHTFEWIENFSLLPADVTRRNDFTGCAITLSNHNFLYTSIRGHNSISVFSLKNHTPTLIQNISCHGNNPRDITICKEGTSLLCANYLSNSISSFEINKNTRITHLQEFLYNSFPFLYFRVYPLKPKST